MKYYHQQPNEIIKTKKAMVATTAKIRKTRNETIRIGIDSHKRKVTSNLKKKLP